MPEAVRGNSTPVPSTRDALAPFRDALTFARVPENVVTTGELRALCVYDAPPDDCFAIGVRNDRMSPHLRKGEWAVVDKADKEPVSGELYFVRITSPMEPHGFRVTLVQLVSKLHRSGKPNPDGTWTMEAEDSIGWWMRFDEPSRRSFMVMSDGPMREEGLRERIIGRVIGVITEDEA